MWFAEAQGTWNRGTIAERRVGRHWHRPQRLDLAARVRNPTDRTVVYGHAYTLPATRLYGGCRGK
jgi:hypothetical protein